MKPLEGYIIAFVAHGPELTLRAEGLRDAGANVRVVSADLDLWTTLGEGSFQVLVLVASAGGPSPSVILGALETDPRTRTIPVLVLVDPDLGAALVRTATAKSMTVLSSNAPDASLVQAIVDLTSAQRNLLEVEVHQRTQLEQYRALAAHANEARSELNNLAHDLRTFLGIVFGFACNLRDGVVGPLNVAQQEHVTRILEATTDATKLLGRTKESGRMPRTPRTLSPLTLHPDSARPGRAQRSLVDLSVVAMSVKSLFEHGAEQESKTLTCTTESVMVWGDALKLKQVIVNLVANAVKYSPPGGAVEIIVRWGKPAETAGPPMRRPAEIVVTNTGAEIPADSRQRIFERGFRLPQHAHLPGQGVGLSIVHEVVTQHAGSVRADAVPGKGTAFTVSLSTDLRVRERGLGVLLVPESEAAGVLVEAIRAARPDELLVMMADRPREFLDLAAACGAYVVVPRGKLSPLSEALAEILTPSSPPGRRQ